jgi:hypothetical protein
VVYTGYSQKNGAISKVITNLFGGRSVGIVRSRTQTMEFFFFFYKFISHPARAQHTLSAARTVLASHSYCGAAGPVSKIASQQEKAFCVLRFEVSRSVITAQGEFRARFKKNTAHKNNVFFKPCTNLTLHCNDRSGHLKTEYTESLLLLRRHLGNWSRGPAVSMRSELLVAHEKRGQLLLLTVYVVSV